MLRTAVFSTSVCSVLLRALIRVLYYSGFCNFVFSSCCVFFFTFVCSVLLCAVICFLCFCVFCSAIFYTSVCYVLLCFVLLCVMYWYVFSSVCSVLLCFVLPCVLTTVFTHVFCASVCFYYLINLNYLFISQCNKTNCMVWSSYGAVCLSGNQVNRARLKRSKLTDNVEIGVNSVEYEGEILLAKQWLWKLVCLGAWGNIVW